MNIIYAYLIILQVGFDTNLDIAYAQNEQYNVCMDIRKRGDKYADLVGLTTKGKITQYGWTITDVAKAIGSGQATVSRWLNPGDPQLPVRALCKICEAIGATPQEVAQEAYEWLNRDFGKPSKRDDATDFPAPNLYALSDAEAEAQTDFSALAADDRTPENDRDMPHAD